MTFDTHGRSPAAGAAATQSMPAPAQRPMQAKSRKRRQQDPHMTPLVQAILACTSREPGQKAEEGMAADPAAHTTPHPGSPTLVSLILATAQAKAHNVPGRSAPADTLVPRPDSRQPAAGQPAEAMPQASPQAAPDDAAAAAQPQEQHLQTAPGPRPFWKVSLRAARAHPAAACRTDRPAETGTVQGREAQAARTAEAAGAQTWAGHPQPGRRVLSADAHARATPAELAASLHFRSRSACAASGTAVSAHQPEDAAARERSTPRPGRTAGAAQAAGQTVPCAAGCDTGMPLHTRQEAALDNVLPAVFADDEHDIATDDLTCRNPEVSLTTFCQTRAGTQPARQAELVTPAAGLPALSRAASWDGPWEVSRDAREDRADDVSDDVQGWLAAHWNGEPARGGLSSAIPMPPAAEDEETPERCSWLIVPVPLPAGRESPCREPGPHDGLSRAQRSAHSTGALPPGAARRGRKKSGTSGASRIPGEARRPNETGAPVSREELRAARRDSTSLIWFVEKIYLPHARLRKRSWLLDNRLLERFILPTFGCMSMASISTSDVERWLDRLTITLAPATCNRILAVFKTVCGLAVRRGMIFRTQDPCANVQNLRCVLCRERFLTSEEAGRLLATLEKDDRKEAMALRLLLLTGARKSELLGARWEDVRLEQQVICVPLSKSGRTRYIYLSSAAMDILHTLQELRVDNCPWVFPCRNGRSPLSDIFGYWRRIRKDMNLQDVRIHDLRHSFASFLVNSGHTLYEAQKLLGHADPRTTMRYAHLTQSGLIAAAEDVSRLMLSAAAIPRSPESGAEPAADAVAR